MADPWIGCWQVVDEDADGDDDGDEIVRYDALYTTMSLRRSGFSVYTSRHFIEIRAAAGRRPPEAFPATEAEVGSWYESSTIAYGTCTWHEAAGGWRVEHATQSRAGRVAPLDDERDVQMEGDRASAAGEQWRRLSGVGTSPLAGAWASAPSTSERSVQWWSDSRAAASWSAGAVAFSCCHGAPGLGEDRSADPGRHRPGEVVHRRDRVRSGHPSPASRSRG